MNNPLAMSDEDVLNMAPPKVDEEANPSSVGSTTTVTTPEQNPDGVVEDADNSAINTAASATSTENKVDDEAEAEKNVADNATEAVTETDAAKAALAGTADTPKTEAKPTETTESDKPVVSPDYKSFYEKVMIPFKANGKMIELKTPEEAIQLMQMGANYTKKLQELQPHRKILLMLQNNGLTDEARLSYLIDLDKKNPEAIKKLIKDSGVDPLDIDTSTEPTYHAGNHKITDEEVAFRNVLDDLSSTTEGKTTLQVINDGWDQASKEVLWKTPELMATMHVQREAGLYQTIVDEMDRQKTLGQLPQNTPFLEAYRKVGDQLMAAGRFNKAPNAVVEKPKVGAVIDRRAGVTKPAVKSGDRADAASPSRSTPRTAKQLVNPLAMSDDEFLKQMANRV